MPADPKDAKVYTFKLDYTDDRGRRWAGSFTNRVLNTRERSLAGTLKAKFLGGAAAQSVDLLTSNLLDAITHMSISLQVKPKWADPLDEIEDPEVLYAIYEEVLAHEGTYFRRKPYIADGESEHEDTNESA